MTVNWTKRLLLPSYYYRSLRNYTRGRLVFIHSGHKLNPTTPRIITSHSSLLSYDRRALRKLFRLSTLVKSGDAVLSTVYDFLSTVRVLSTRGTSLR